MSDLASLPVWLALVYSTLAVVVLAISCLMYALETDGDRKDRWLAVCERTASTTIVRQPPPLTVVKAVFDYLHSLGRRRKG